MTPTPLAANAIAELVQFDDFTMYYAAYGEGEPLILLHADLSNSDDWRRQVALFAQQYRVITPDFRGNGRSTDGEVDWSYDLMADDVVRLMDYLQIDKARIVGWTTGAVTGLELARQYPERVRALVTYAGWTRPSGLTGTVEKWIREATLAELENEMSYDYSELSPAPDHLPVMLERTRDLLLSEPNLDADALASIEPPDSDP